MVAGKTCTNYSAYNGSSVVMNADAVAAGRAIPLVYGHETTYSENKTSYDNNYVEQTKGNVVSMAVENIGNKGGEVFVAGTVFLSDYEVKDEIDDYALTYANRQILLNILSSHKSRMQATDIATVRKADMGEVFAIEGYVTAGTVTEGNTFFDTIYVQDDTAGITLFPIATPGIRIGQKVHVEGYVDAYQGDKELQVIIWEIMEGDEKVYEPAEVTTKEAADYEANGGRLVKVTGKVTKIVLQGADIQYIHVMDDSGVEAVVFTDGYITDSTGYEGLINDVSVGSVISAVGLVYTNPDGVVMRVRDRAEIKVLSQDTPVTPPADDEKDTPVTPPADDEKDTPVTPPASDEKDTPVTPPASDEKDTPVTPPASDEKDTPVTPPASDEKEVKEPENNTDTKGGNTKQSDNRASVITNDKNTDNTDNTNSTDTDSHGVPVEVQEKPTETANNTKINTGAVVKTEVSHEAVKGIEYTDGFFYTANETRLENTIVEVENGDKYILNGDGKKYVSQMVEVDNGDRYITNNKGVVITNAIVNTGSERYYAGKDGVIQTGRVITVDSNKYYVTKKTGKIVTGKIVKINGNRYYATKKTGKFVTSKVFKLDGKKYVAGKSGKLVQSKWVTMGNMKYYCNKRGVVTKAKKVKK